MFGSQSSALRPGGGLFGSSPATATATGTSPNPMNHIEVSQPPEDSIQTLKFSPATVVANNFLASGSWDNIVRVWDVKANGATEPKAQQSMQGPILEIDWSDDGSKIFVGSADHQAKIWDLQANQFIQVAQHDAPIKTVHWIKGQTYQCLMTGSWDKTLKFWDTRQPQPMSTITLPERVYAADVVYPMAVVCLAQRAIMVFKLDGQPSEYKRIESPLKYQHRCVAIFKNATNPVGFALGSIEGRVAIQYVDAPANAKDNFTFKCHRSPDLNNGFQDIFAVNHIAFHPTHSTLATVGGDGKFSFWDKDARTKLKTSEKFENPISCSAFNKDGTIYAYAVCYDWSKGHENYNPAAKNRIFMYSCFDDLKPRPKK